MTTREEIIELARECGIKNRVFPQSEVWGYERNIEAFFQAAQHQAYERAAAIAEENLADEPYGHAAFRCVSISNAIRALIVQKSAGA